MIPRTVYLLLCGKLSRNFAQQNPLPNKKQTHKVMHDSDLISMEIKQGGECAYPLALLENAT